MNLQGLADEQLMLRAHANDPAAFEALYDRHSHACFSLAYGIMRSQAAAQDVTQEAFLSVWRNRAGYRANRGSVKTWALGIVRHKAIDALRRASSRPPTAAGGELLEDRAHAPELTDVEVLARDDARSVRSLVDALPDEQRRTIELAYFEGLSHCEIAQRLELPLGTVKGRVRLGLERLRGTREIEAA